MRLGSCLQGQLASRRWLTRRNLHKVRRLEWILLPVCVDVLFSVVVSCLLVRAERLHMVGRLVFIKARGEVL